MWTKTAIARFSLLFFISHLCLKSYSISCSKSMLPSYWGKRSRNNILAYTRVFSFPMNVIYSAYNIKKIIKSALSCYSILIVQKYCIGYLFSSWIPFISENFLFTELENIWPRKEQETGNSASRIDYETFCDITRIMLRNVHLSWRWKEIGK